MLDLIILLIFLFFYFYKYETFNTNSYFSSNNQIHGSYHFLTDRYKCNYLKNIKKQNLRKENNAHPLNSLLYNRNLQNVDSTINLEQNLPFKKINLDGVNYIPSTCTANKQNMCMNVNLSELLEKIPITSLNNIYISKILDRTHLKKKMNKIYKILEFLTSHLEKFELNNIQYDNEEILEININKKNDCKQCFECKFLIDLHINQLHKSFKLFIHFEYSYYKTKTPIIITKNGYIYINKIKIINSTHLKHFVKGYDYKKKNVLLNSDKISFHPLSNPNIKIPYNGYQDYIRNSTESDNILSKTQRENILQDKLDKKEENLKNCFYNRDECINTNIPVSFKSWMPNIY